MSNCLHFLRYSPCFNSDDMDIEGYKRFIQSIPATEIYREAREKLGEGSDEMMGWWFLARNSEFHDYFVQIHFGRGRSSHTYRDFQGTLDVLKQFILRNYFYTFKCTGEEDGFAHPFDWRVNFKQGSTR